MTCLICSEKTWACVDQYRKTPAGMIMCVSCGFVTYSDLNKQALEDSYKNYRNKISAANHYSALTKANHHIDFIGATEIKGPALEVGCGVGLFLGHLKHNGLDVYGTELDDKARTTCELLHGVNMSKTPDWSRRYGFIASFHVAEHQLDIHEQLLQYRESLLDDGYLYIGVPIWFHKLSNFGVGGYDWDYYYHKNHINVWSKDIFEKLLKKSGFKIIKERFRHSGSAQYLCVKSEKQNVGPFHNNTEDSLLKIKHASEHFEKKEYLEAIGYWPNFPEAHTRLIKQMAVDKNSNEAILKQLRLAIIQCENDRDIRMMYARALIQLGKLSDARDNLLLIMDYDKAYPTVHFYYADLLVREGLRRQAIQHLDKVASQFTWMTPTFVEKIYEIATND